ncbi:MAG: glycoside hydrolase family 5 protein [Armatimonadota bacterium]
MSDVGFVAQCCVAVALGVAALGVSSAHGAEGLPLLRAGGANWMDSAGNVVMLRGCNLGNWFVQEMWMHAMGTEGIPDQYTMEQVLARRFGEATKDRLMETYRANYITARDFEIIKSFGMNVVRLPILYTLLEDDSHPFELRAQAWEQLDRAIGMAEAAGIYTILDLHGAPGGQNPWDHSGRADQNGLWGNEGNKRRTVWLWREIAKHYRGRTAIAGYDLLNEPYTAPKPELRELMLEVYRAVREVDPDHVIILPAMPDGFDFYGDLKEQGLSNVALDAHFYPGLFGWGSPGRGVHEEWLSRGVREAAEKARAAQVPVLVGEMNVVFRTAGGAEMMRRSYETYGGFGWAVTMWSYKVLSREGGIGNGSWGMVTNPPAETAPLVSAETWAGRGWDSGFADAWGRHETRYRAPGEGPVTVYLVLKAWAGEGGRAEVVFDDVGLTDEATGKQMASNGGFGTEEGWRRWSGAGKVAADFAYNAGEPTGGRGPCLRLSAEGGASGGVYQALKLEGGRSYRLSGVFRDLGCSAESVSVEVYLRRDAPVDGQDYVAGGAPGSEVDLNCSSAEEIEAYFRSLATMEYVMYDELREALAGMAAATEMPSKAAE